MGISVGSSNGTNSGNNSSAGTGNGGGGSGEMCTVTMSMECSGGLGHTSPQNCNVGDGWSVTFNIPCPPDGSSSRNNQNARGGEIVNPCDGDVALLLDEDFLCAMDDDAFNNYYSQNSPFNVDLSDVRVSCVDSITTPDENKKFMCIYNKLLQSPKFKSLFVDTFGEEDNNMDIKFEIGDLLQSNGFRPDGKTISNNLDVREQTIILDESLLNSNHPLIVAQTIIHEALHAFINVKQVECIPSPNSTTTYNYINDLNQLTFDELLNDFVLDCDVNQPVAHRLMYNRMVDAMDEILAEVFSDLVASENQDLTDNPIYMYPPPNGIQHSFNWDDALHYLNLSGLQEATEYIQDNQQDPSISFFVDKYNIYLNDPARFIQNTCND